MEMVTLKLEEADMHQREVSVKTQMCTRFVALSRRAKQKPVILYGKGMTILEKLRLRATHRDIAICEDDISMQKY